MIGLSAQRVGDVVSFEAEVTDDGPATDLGYLWEFSRTQVFANPRTNPAELLGYDETVEQFAGIAAPDTPLRWLRTLAVIKTRRIGKTGSRTAEVTR